MPEQIKEWKTVETIYYEEIFINDVSLSLTLNSSRPLYENGNWGSDHLNMTIERKDNDKHYFLRLHYNHNRDEVLALQELFSNFISQTQLMDTHMYAIEQSRKNKVREVKRIRKLRRTRNNNHDQSSPDPTSV